MWQMNESAYLVRLVTAHPKKCSSTNRHIVLKWPRHKETSLFFLFFCPELVHMFSNSIPATDIQPLVRVPHMGLRDGLDDGPLLHLVGARLGTVQADYRHWNPQSGGPSSPVNTQCERMIPVLWDRENILNCLVVYLYMILACFSTMFVFIC